MEDRMEDTQRRRAINVAAIVLVAGLLAACGGSDGADSPEVASLDEGSTSGSTPDDAATDGEVTEADREQALLDFAECMRDHGIDMPDPQISEEGGGVLIQQDGSGIDPESAEFHEADEACQPILEDAMGEIEVDPERQAEMQEQLLEFAECMRDHGIDMEDPVFDENGRVEIQAIGRGSGGDPRDDEDFQAAEEACGQDGGIVARPGPGPGSAGGEDAGDE
jgi:hypothetical protein